MLPQKARTWHRSERCNPFSNNFHCAVVSTKRNRYRNILNLSLRGGAVQRTEVVASARPIPMSFILMAVFAVHLPLLLMGLPLKSYDTNFHIFFASHYLHHWFNPWNAKWYAGFSQTTYPPLPQQWIALVSPLLGPDLAFMAVQFAAILLLAV